MLKDDSGCWRHSNEELAKMSETHSGYKNPMYGKHPIPWNKRQKGCFVSPKKGLTRAEYYGEENDDFEEDNFGEEEEWGEEGETWQRSLN